MKFTKFMKSLNGEGKVWNRKDGSRWLVSPACMMKIPEEFGAVVASSISDMPDTLEKDLNEIGYYTKSAELVAAKIPADGKIADVLRIYANPDEYDTVRGTWYKTAIAQEFYTLLEKTDIVELLVNIDDEKKLKPLVIKNENTDSETETIGYIMPVRMKED